MHGRAFGAGWRRDEGFTLIELLVVVLLIGVLSAIAIPIFLNQREKAVDASLKADIKNAVTSVETWLIDNPSSPVPPDVAGDAITGVLDDARTSGGNTVKVAPIAGVAGGYVVTAGSAESSRGAGICMRYRVPGGSLDWGACL